MGKRKTAAPAEPDAADEVAALEVAGAPVAPSAAEAAGAAVAGVAVEGAPSEAPSAERASLISRMARLAGNQSIMLPTMAHAPAAAEPAPAPESADPTAAAPPSNSARAASPASAPLPPPAAATASAVARPAAWPGATEGGSTEQLLASQRTSLAMQIELKAPQRSPPTMRLHADGPLARRSQSIQSRDGSRLLAPRSRG